MASPVLFASAHEVVLPAQDEPLYEIVDGQRVDLLPMGAYARPHHGAGLACS